MPGGPGPVLDQDRRAGRRGAPGLQRDVRVRRHGHQQRAARAARPQGARATRPGEGRHLDHRAAGEAPRRGLGRGHPGDGLGGAADPLAHARRDVVATARGARRAPVAVPGRGPPRDAVPAWAPLGGGSGASRPRGAVQRRHPRAAGRRAHARVPAPAHHRPASRLVQHGRADRGVRVADAPGRDDRRVARGCGGARGRCGGDRPRELSPRVGRGAGARSTRDSAPGSCS